MTEREILSCFAKQTNGMWACIRPVTIQAGGASMSISPGMSFSPGLQFMGVDLGQYLNGLSIKYGV
jgi:hypothetical protein